MVNIQSARLAHNTDSDVHELADMLHELHHTTDKYAPQFILLDIRTADIERLRQLVLHLKDMKRIYHDYATMYFAILLGEQVLQDVFEALLKTLTQRDYVQYFVQPERANKWLQLEHAKYQSKIERQAQSS